jgi:hypothetical protein
VFRLIAIIPFQVGHKLNDFIFAKIIGKLIIV